MNIKIWIGIISLVVVLGSLTAYFIKIGREDGDWLGAAIMGVLGYLIFLVWCFT